MKRINAQTTQKYCNDLPQTAISPEEYSPILQYRGSGVGRVGFEAKKWYKMPKAMDEPSLCREMVLCSLCYREETKREMNGNAGQGSREMGQLETTQGCKPTECAGGNLTPHNAALPLLKAKKRQKTFFNGTEKQLSPVLQSAGFTCHWHRTTAWRPEAGLTWLEPALNSLRRQPPM